MRANRLGLYADHTGRRGEVLGHDHRGFTYLSLISATHDLDRALG
jgi:hypothetical protein